MSLENIVKQPVGITGPVGVTFGPVGVSGVVGVSLLNPIGITGILGVSLLNPIGITGILGISIALPVGITGIVGVSLLNPIGITGSVGTTFGAINGNVGVSGFVGVTFGSVGVTFPALTVGNTGSIGITGSVGVTFGAINGNVGISGFVGATFGAVNINELTDAGTTFALTSAQTTAYSSTLIIKASAGKLIELIGYNSKTSSQFIQIHNTTTVPADTAVPIDIFFIPASSNFSLDFTKWGKRYSTGITVCNSSTGPTKTIGSADCWFSAVYI